MTDLSGALVSVWKTCDLMTGLSSNGEAEEIFGLGRSEKLSILFWLAVCVKAKLYESYCDSACLCVD